VGHDFWFAIRRIRHRPLHSAVVALTLGLGIGASLAIFAVVDAVLLRPLPYPEPGRLVRVTQTIPVPGALELPYSDVGFRRLAHDARTLSAVAAWDTRDANLVGPTSPRRLIVARVTATLFDVLRTQPSLGRGFTRDEDLPNGPRVLVLSDWLWRSAFNADPDVVGRVANLEGEPFTIVGVLPPSVSFPSREIAAWEPLGLDPAAVNPYQIRYAVIGRLGAGTTLDQARRDLTPLVRAVGREYPGPHPGSALDPAGYLAHVRPLADDLVGDARPVVMLLLAGVLMLLLLTCANVANLQLAAVIVRGEELAVRAALGATRSRLVRGALIEGVVLTAVGAVLGFVVAGFGARLLASLMPQGIALGGPLLGGRALAVTILAVLGIGAAVGALPVAVVARRDPALGLRDRAGAGPARAGRTRRILAAAQVALAVLLAHGSGLLIASARAVHEVRLGFRPDSTISLRVNLPSATLRDRSARESLLRRLVTEIGALPGVTAAGLVNALPLNPGRRDLAMAVEGRPFKADGTDPMADYRVVSHGYFAAMGIALRRGRVFTDYDAGERHTPLVISEGLARRLFPDGEDPIGQRLRFGPAAPWMPIVGVVADAKNRSLTEEPRPELYAPGLGTWAMLAFQTEITIVARARGDAMGLAVPIQRIVSGAAPDVATYNLASLADIVRQARARMTTATRLMSGYAATALLLAMAGTYAVLSYLVTQRRGELAVRMALGATPRGIVALVARESVMLIGIGVVTGLAGAAVSARLLSGLLFGVGALDRVVVLLVVVAAGAAGLVAAVFPARRATRVDPTTSLRGGG
jgi:predicted permease